MQTLAIDPAIPFVLPATQPITIGLIGCGGTGSHIAQSLARLCAHLYGRSTVALVFMDGDTVEQKNVGRQLFSQADVGKNKAQVLALRFSSLFGMRITALAEMATSGMLSNATLNSSIGILVGAVDSGAGRRALHAGLKYGPWRLWLDCGNNEHDGQIAIGSATERSQLRRALVLGSVCSELPAPSLLYPDLLNDAPAQPRADCATAMADDAQSLMVNQMMAAIAAEYLYQLAVERRVTTFRTTVDLRTLTMRSTPITAANLTAEVPGLTLAELVGTRSKKKARAAA